MPAPNVDTSQPVQRRRLALVIGVNKAPGALVPALRYAESDAQAIAEALEQHGNYTLFQPPLLGSQATSYPIKQTILRLLRECTKDDVLLLYFSGHGKLLLVEQADQPGFDQAYLVTYDFSEKDAEDDPPLHLSLRWLRDQMFNRAKAAQVLLILDCCYSGELGRTGPNPQVQDLLQRIADYFKLPATTQGARSGGLRLALTATGHLQTVPEQDGHGIMSGPLLRALRGEVDDVLSDEGAITFTRLLDYLFTEMPSGNKPSYLGDSAAQSYILAWHPERAAALRRLRAHIDVAEQPMTYIPFPRNRLFQPRPGEFAHLEALLSGEAAQRGPVHLGLIGVVGMGGVGKTKLAVELAYRSLEAQRYADGIFWTVAKGRTVADWQRHLAELAFNTNYLPPGDDPARPDNERRRAMHLCRYLAAHQDALLILDNVDAPELINTALPALAGGELACAVLYTSRNTTKPRGVEMHKVDVLPEEGALCLLLETSRPAILEAIQLKEANDAQAEAAHAICQRVGLLPLALVHLRGLLERDPQLALTRLEQVLIERGALALATTEHEDAAPLFATFDLSWESVRDEAARDLFALACYFPEAAPIPLWLLGLAAGLGEEGTIIDPLGQARLHLQELNLLEAPSSEQVRLHPLVREFGQALAASHPEQGALLRSAALQRLVSFCTDLHTLESRAQREGFWICLKQIRVLHAYATCLGGQVPEIACIEHWLDQESYLLGDEQLWPETLPSLFYQQLFNRTIEEAIPFITTHPPLRWLRQESPVRAKDRSLLRIFVARGAVKDVAFSPDGNLLLTGLDNGTAQLWESASGHLVQTFDTYNGKYRSVVNSVAFSPGGSLVLMGSYDGMARLWEWASGRLIQTFDDHNGKSVTSVAFSPDGKQVLTGSYEGTARLRELASGKIVHNFDSGGNPSRDLVNSVAFSPDGSLMFINFANNGIQQRERASGRLVRTLKNRHYNDVVLSPNGSQMLTVSGFSSYLLESVSGRLIHTFKGNSQLVTSVAFSPDGSKVLIGSDDGIAQLWELASGHLVQTLEGHNDSIESAAFSPDGSQILIGSHDGTARLWKFESSVIIQTPEYNSGKINKAIFSPDGKLLCTSEWENTTIKLWDQTSRRLIHTFKGHSQLVTSVAFSPDGRQLLIGSWDSTAQLLESASGQLMQTFKGHTAHVTSVAFSPDGGLVLTGSSDGIVRLWERISGQLVQTFRGHNSEGWQEEVAIVAFSPCSNQILTVSHWEDGYEYRTSAERLWDRASGQLIHTFEDSHSLVNSVAFSPDGSLVLTGSGDSVAQLWELASGRLVRTFEDYSGTGWTYEDIIVAFSPDGQFIAMCVRNGRILFWKIQGEHEQGSPLGLYVASYPIKAIYWQETRRMMLADTGGVTGHPNVYQLRLEGMW